MSANFAEFVHEIVHGATERRKYYKLKRLLNFFDSRLLHVQKISVIASILFGISVITLFLYPKNISMGNIKLAKIIKICTRDCTRTTQARRTYPKLLFGFLRD